MQLEESAEVGTSAMTAARAEVVVEVAAAAKSGRPTRAARKKRKAADGDDDDDGDYDNNNNNGEDDYAEGLNRGSARKGGRMTACEMCGKTFLLRGEAPERLLCGPCRRSVEKAERQKSAAAKRVSRAAAALPAAKQKRQRRRIKKTEGGLLEQDAGLPSLQDLCVRTIARHVDQVESFGDIGAQSLNRICRIICKMRVLDEATLRLFVGPERTAVTLYDCTKITPRGIAVIADSCPALETLSLEFCGRLDGEALLALGRGLPRLAHVRLDGAFLVGDDAWAGFFREAGPRLRSVKVAFAGFGPGAMRALVAHCAGLAELRVAECSDFDDDCLATLAPPLTEREEMAQEAERLERARRDRSRKGKAAEGAEGAEGAAVPAWQRLARLVSLELPRPHKPMGSATATRVVRTLGAQLRVLDLAGFRDLDDGFARALAEHGRGIEELGLAGCNEISAAAFGELFAAGRGFARVDVTRCYGLTDAVVRALVQHSAATLHTLSLNSVDDSLTVAGLLALAGLADAPGLDRPEQRMPPCAALEELDLSWVRCASDAALAQILPRCPRLARIRVYGCPAVTSFAPARPGLAYTGRESDTL
ncbi:UV-damaged DNA-binding protein rad7 [Coemansia javaensis]|uniref:UV-damaged DNA-binding protein rad7 n=1 Tax=Coemansia javaensis TaxID=2761396 RepID=A0A9W8HEL5_9FUNG|nr:UV-damaged DNA-binding protein rad7 [Coemansia javaensis]